MKKRTSYNERAWAIDLISEINRLSAVHSRTIQRAGGEWGLSPHAGGKMLFPDVLLFGDASQHSVLQGWELKLPDTAVTDEGLLQNAQEKARRLGLTSFLVWNAVDAVLYRIADGSWAPEKTWRCDSIVTRKDVQTKRAAWIETLALILKDLNDYFEHGKLPSQPALPTQLNEVVAAIIEDGSGLLEESLRGESRRSLAFRSEVSVWWRGAKAEHGNPKDDVRFSRLATEILLHWLHRFLFAHYLKRFLTDAAGIDDLGAASTPQDAEKIFKAISSKRDFAQVFSPRMGAVLLPTRVWRDLLSFNDFLKAVRIDKLDQHLFHITLQAVRQESQRKVAGQFCTPPALAELLARLTIDDLNAPVLDPCCGTGTIARAVYDLKTTCGISSAAAVRTTWASDLYAMPLQFATLALASGESPFETLLVFGHDVLTLTPGIPIAFTDAKSGKPMTKKLPHFPAVVLNPPFVRFEDWMRTEPSISEINDYLRSCAGEGLDTKTDYFAPIILHLYRLLAADGRVGSIFPNAWLGADWAVAFRRILQKFFSIEMVLTSGAGRWFQNADIVTNLVVLKRRKQVNRVWRDETTTFGVTTRPLSAWGEEEPGVIADALTIAAQSGNGAICVNRVSAGELAHFDSLGLCWSAHFTNLNWFKPVERFLTLASTYFEVSRGERRGWDDLFFPPEGASIESQYLQPVLMSAASSPGLIATADGRAFCCSCSLDELRKLGHSGALAWIGKFQQAKNRTGQPLTQVLARGGLQWYEMRSDTTADLAVSLNPDKRLCFMRLTPRAFVNQRLIRLTARSSTVDLDLAHAMLCSVMGCFYLEALGFGRGLGVLDLNASKLARQMRMLDPKHVPTHSRKSILSAFDRLLKRKVLSLEEELQQSDRMAFECAVFECFGLLDVLPRVQESVLALHRIRCAACQQKANGKKS